MAPLLELEERQWLLRSLSELIAKRGSRAFLTAPLLEPTNRFFPDAWEPSARGVQVLARRLLTYAGLGELDAEVSTFSQPDEIRELNQFGGAQSWGHEGAAAWFAGIAGRRCLFGVAVERMSEPETVVATMCHEVAHAYRRFHRLAVEDRDTEERLTDVTTIYLGFGLLTTNGSYVYRASGGLAGDRAITRWSHSHAGYLSPEAMSFLLAAQARARRMGFFARSHLAGQLESIQASFFRAALELLEEGPGLDVAPMSPGPAPAAAPEIVPMQLEGGAPEEEEARARRPWNVGGRVFRVRRSKIWAFGLAGAALGLLAAFVLQLLMGMPAVAWSVFWLAVAVGVVLGKRARWDYCSDHDCEEILDPSATQCPRCGGTIAGDVRSQPPRELDDGPEPGEGIDQTSPTD